MVPDVLSPLSGLPLLPLEPSSSPLDPHATMTLMVLQTKNATSDRMRMAASAGNPHAPPRASSLS
jgi:hypothetical protein